MPKAREKRRRHLSVVQHDAEIRLSDLWGKARMPGHVLRRVVAALVWMTYHHRREKVARGVRGNDDVYHTVRQASNCPRDA